MQVQKLIQKFRRESRIASYVGIVFVVLTVFQAAVLLWQINWGTHPERADPQMMWNSILWLGIWAVFSRATNYLADLAEAIAGAESTHVPALVPPAHTPANSH